MQLLNLYIEDYKVLQQFNIQFSEEFSVDDSLNVIIGKNGAGKTTLIECLLKIFSSLYSCNKVEDVSKITNKKLGFQFTLSYFIRTEKIIEAASTFSEHKVDYVKITLSNINKEWFILEYENKKLINQDVNNFLFKSQYTLQDLLPKNTVLYYAGFDSRLSGFVQNYTSDYFKEWFTFLENDSKGLDINAPVFYFNPIQFNLLLFSIFCNQSSDIAVFFKDKFGIVGFTEVVLKLKMPTWHRSNPASEYWGAKGILKEALLKFEKASQDTEVLKRSITHSYFIPDVLIGLVGFRSEDSFTSEKEVFQSLVALDVMGLLDEIQITLVKETDGINSEISSQDLSEGEKQLISIYGLKQILSSNEESLFLFDEPDTFLHPKWKKEFFKNIYYDQQNTKIHYGDFDIITTHSPEIIGNIDLNTSLKRLVDGKIYDSPLYVKGRDYNSILYEAFDSVKRGEFGRELIDEFYKLLESKQVELAKQKLDEIINTFGLDDIETQKAIDNFDDYN
ncbi:AAA family ATPase [Empedobacter brevis]|uniref:AAA family ATPase n=1 Tax=Empedobacter brevis TaxID=247 RepID=A0AAJ1QEG5_9FLAO|nr:MULTISPECIES: AAA family ATPase [Bacteroidota]MCI5092939.1 AAA family ATPase [Phaeodactylibacter sp.]MDM1072588.1 AAA family ATPase [Empedobacter brevis]|tara:strand:+ start:2137 stop:3654 length:1518 start_codon:yes stop_codon:yes gene_type:complete